MGVFKVEFEMVSRRLINQKTYRIINVKPKSNNEKQPTLRSGGGWECTVRGGLKGVVAVSGRRYDRAGPAGLYSAVDAGDAAPSMGIVTEK